MIVTATGTPTVSPRELFFAAIGAAVVSTSLLLVDAIIVVDVFFSVALKTGSNGRKGVVAGLTSMKLDGELAPTILLAITLNLYFYPAVIVKL